MIAVLSATEHDFYAMPLPFVCYSWRKLGFYPLVFVPKGDYPKLSLAKKYCPECEFVEFECEDYKIPTFSQVIRLFGAAYDKIFFNPNTFLITGDSDMAVFSDFFERLNDGEIHVVGHDLTPEDQYPMCYVGMQVYNWVGCMNMGAESPQEHVAKLIDPIQSNNLRGDAWAYDQWYLKKMLTPYKDLITFHTRSNGQNQFATRRADRDGWHFNIDTIIDAHLPRPLIDGMNFQKVVDLFTVKFPHQDLSWMHNFRNEYLELL